jgi:hypothetical protein
MIQRIVVFFLCCISAFAAAPRFEDYSVSQVYRGPIHTPRFGRLSRYQGTDIRCFSADPELYTSEPANFAGHFVIRACSCGSGCHYLFMWDALTGKVYPRLLPGSIDVNSFNEVDYAGEEARPDSALLTVEACVEDTCDCGKWYYRWTGKQLKLLYREPVRLPPYCLKH